MGNPLQDVRHIIKHPAARGIRVVVLDVGATEDFGVGEVRANPWVDVNKIPWPLSLADIENLNSHGFPLSLADTLESGAASPEQQLLVLQTLHCLVSASANAADMLNCHRRLPMSVKPKPNKTTSGLVTEIEQLCKGQLHDTDAHSGELDWTRWASNYEVWLKRDSHPLVKIFAQGAGKDRGVFDMGGVHLTGGRMWAGSLMMMRYCYALASNRLLHFGAGRILELGAGTGILGISLAKLDLQVVLSDREPCLLERMASNISRNGVDDNCKLLDLDWAAAAKPKMRRLLAAQRFSAVVGADIIYEEEHCDLLLNVLRHALSAGGVAYIANAAKYRRGVECFSSKAQACGYTVRESTLTCDGILQDHICGEHEAAQQYIFFTVHVPPLVDTMDRAPNKNQ